MLRGGGGAQARRFAPRAARWESSASHGINHHFCTPLDPLQNDSFPLPTFRSILASAFRAKTRRLYGMDSLGRGWRSAADACAAQALREKSFDAAAARLAEHYVPAQFCAASHVDPEVAEEADRAVDMLLESRAKIAEHFGASAVLQKAEVRELQHVRQVRKLREDADEVLFKFPARYIVPEVAQMLGYGEKDDVSVRRPIIGMLLSSVVSSDLRMRLFRLGHSHSAPLSSALAQLLELRHEVATLRDSPSYAALRMAEDCGIAGDGAESEAERSVEEALVHVGRKARQRLLLMGAEKKRVEGSSELFVWDIPFYQRQLFKGQGLVDPHMPSPFLSLGAVVSGLDELLRSYFGLRIDLESMSPGEAWIPSVRKLVVRTCDDAKEELRGTIYLDLIQHPRKAASTEYCAAVRLTPPDYEGSGGAKVASVAVVCSALYPHRNMPAFFSYADLRGFLHEFGHALRVLQFTPRPAGEFLRLRPSNCRLVDEELHARLFERFAEDYEIVRRFAVHHETGESPSRAQFDEWLRSFHYFGSLSQQLQLVRTLTDLRFHGRTGSARTNLSDTYLAAYHSSALPHVAGVHPYLRDSSFVLQGGSLYAGILAETRADELWSKHVRGRGGVSRGTVGSLYEAAAKI